MEVKWLHEDLKQWTRAAFEVYGSAGGVPDKGRELLDVEETHQVDETANGSLTIPLKAKLHVVRRTGTPDRYIIISFKGTTPSDLREWLFVNLATSQVKLKLPLSGQSLEMKVHKGFHDCYNHHFQGELGCKIRRICVKRQDLSKLPIVVVGHSLGGALATLCAVDIAMQIGQKASRIRSIYLCTFGRPGVGDERFCKHVEDWIDGNLRFVGHRDLVPSLPPKCCHENSLPTLKWKAPHADLKDLYDISRSAAEHQPATWVLTVSGHQASNYWTQVESLNPEGTPSLDQGIFWTNYCNTTHAQLRRTHKTVTAILKFVGTLHSNQTQLMKKMQDWQSRVAEQAEDILSRLQEGFAKVEDRLDRQDQEVRLLLKFAQKQDQNVREQQLPTSELNGWLHRFEQSLARNDEDGEQLVREFAKEFLDKLGPTTFGKVMHFLEGLDCSADSVELFRGELDLVIGVLEATLDCFIQVQSAVGDALQENQRVFLQSWLKHLPKILLDITCLVVCLRHYGDHHPTQLLGLHNRSETFLCAFNDTLEHFIPKIFHDKQARLDRFAHCFPRGPPEMLCILLQMACDPRYQQRGATPTLLLIIMRMTLNERTGSFEFSSLRKYQELLGKSKLVSLDNNLRPLFDAVGSVRMTTELSRLLLERNPKSREECLLIIDDLLATEVKLRQEEWKDAQEKYGNGGLGLLSAATDSNLTAVSSFLYNDVDVNTTNYIGYTALMEASKNGCVELVEELIRMKAEVNLQTDYDKTALMFAAEEGHKRVVEVLAGISDTTLQDICV